MTDPDPLMPIGMFSRASLVSVKALRSYHELGLLVPASVDPDTGYRSYRVSQLTDAAIIKRLRDLDVPLADIGEVVRARDPEVTRKVLANHEATMQARLAQVERIVDELQQTIATPSLHTPVHVRTEPATHALMMSGVVDESGYAEFLGHAYGTLYATLLATGAVMAGPSAARYAPAIESGTEPVDAYLPIAAPVALDDAGTRAGVVLALVPEATCAVLTHAGGFDSIGDTYRQLGAWVARHAVSADQPVREHYVVSVDETTGQLLPDEQLRTEIAWPILARPTGTAEAPPRPPSPPSTPSSTPPPSGENP